MPADSEDTQAIFVPCPTCQQPSAYAAHNRWRPFCSQRCKMIDLGAWASGDYRVPAPPDAGNSGADDRD
ncbi:hypothetical protein SAMN02745117_02508 [Lampropedia hyalina DSM 16112]|uniref:DNA gyrase inhibitor YacG n=1 Tax=Lampropedia hyalina DSM 16112 TaxID=1122156 RepID=A0A1M5E2K1_9BURK|nr:DNA gyrase inhibitor YacG [Lampropedia hyalina]SHF73457.1 hypothetical protein SAMN02745117_02508 [Lampropedia hyalina DSM 16112]